MHCPSCRGPANEARATGAPGSQSGALSRAASRYLHSKPALPLMASGRPSPCDVAALKACLEKNDGNAAKCVAEIEKFKAACGGGTAVPGDAPLAPATDPPCPTACEAPKPA